MSVNFDQSFINNFEKNVDGLDLAKANQIIAKYFPKDKLQFVLVGKSADIKKIAEKYGKVTEVQIISGKRNGFPSGIRQRKFGRIQHRNTIAGIRNMQNQITIGLPRRFFDSYCGFCSNGRNDDVAKKVEANFHIRRCTACICGARISRRTDRQLRNPHTVHPGFG